MKMVLLSGPRQCGKTTLARQLCAELAGRYYSHDQPDDRRALRQRTLAADARLWIFDELHKMRSWRNWLKGVYDEHGRSRQILVTGSARLEHYGRGGDSLQGRYYGMRLHPFTLGELLGTRFDWGAVRTGELDAAPRGRGAAAETVDALFHLSGFPEPLLGGSERRAARWRLAYGARLVGEEVRDLERVLDLDKLELLVDRLPACVGSPLSVNALREDLEVAHGTVVNWLTILERLYGVFRVVPYGVSRVRAIKKAPKLYFWDWARVSESGPRFENMVAVHLLRLCHWLADVEGEKVELRYFRTVLGREVDFIVASGRRPLLAVECKVGEEAASPNLGYLLDHLGPVPAVQVSLNGTRDTLQRLRAGHRVRVLPAATFLANLP